MVNSGERRCIGEDRFRWATASELSGDGTVPPVPVDGDIPVLLEAILTKLTRLVEIQEDSVWDPITYGNYPYAILNTPSWPTGTVKQEILLPVAARSFLLICDQDIIVNLYDRNAPDFPVQNVSGSADYPVKQLSLWSLPRSRAIDKIYVTNNSGSTVNIQIIAWG